MQPDAHAFLLTLQQLQLGIMADEIRDLGFGSLTYSASDSSPYFNNVLVNAPTTSAQVQTAEKIWLTKKRASTFYFENRTGFSDFKTQLTSQGYQQTFEDCWMFHSGNNIDTARFDQVKKVTKLSDLEIFTQVLDQSFQKDDPQNPYGELGEYLDIAKTAWLKFQGSNRLAYFLAFQTGRPVAVAALTNFHGHGYISNVGTLRTVRGQGFGKLVTLYAVAESIARGNTQHFLGTEAGHFPHEFYTRLGFVTKYHAVGWGKAVDFGKVTDLQK